MITQLIVCALKIRRIQSKDRLCVPHFFKENRVNTISLLLNKACYYGNVKRNVFEIVSILTDSPQRAQIIRKSVAKNIRTYSVVIIFA